MPQLVQWMIFLIEAGKFSQNTRQIMIKNYGYQTTLGHYPALIGPPQLKSQTRICQLDLHTPTNEHCYKITFPFINDLRRFCRVLNNHVLVNIILVSGHRQVVPVPLPCQAWLNILLHNETPCPTNETLICPTCLTCRVNTCQPCKQVRRRGRIISP